ncbi:MAG: MFS transporter [Betaproteobacteria bacterium]|nr:MFS transporter [Betaproteobacteria bacterium]
MAGATVPASDLAHAPAHVAAVALTTFAQIGAVMGIAVFAVVAPAFARDLGVDPALIGYQMSVIYGAAMFGSPLLIWMVARWGACRTIQLGLACTVLALTLALTATLPALALASIMLGLAMCIMTPAGSHVLFRFSPAKSRNLTFSIKQTCVPAGWMLMALIAPAVTLTLGWRWALALVMLFCVMMIALLQPVRALWDEDRGPQARGTQRASEGLTLLWRYPVLRALSAASLFLSAVQLCLSSFAVTLLVQDAGYTLIAAGLMLSVAQGAGVAARIAWGWVADRSGDCLGVLAKIGAVIVVCCLAMSQMTGEWPRWVSALLFLVFGATAIGWNGLFLAEIAARCPQGKVSVATAGAMVWNFAGILLGPALFALGVRLSGSYTQMFAWLTLFALAGLALLMRARGHVQREGAP